MTIQINTLFSAVSFFCLLSCQGQPTQSNTPPVTVTNKLVGGGCDGCEIMYAGMPATMNAVDTSAGWTEKGQKLLVTGTVYKLEGKTPAPNVIIYYWHTDNDGHYSPGKGQTEPARRHGHIRGWMKTDAQGKYALYTIRPAPYPNATMPAHIHIAVKESAIANEYYIDEFVFDDDKLLTGEKRKKLENRGGSGILRVLLAGDQQIAEHTIVLGLNIPNYPKSSQSGRQSGLPIGEDSPSFTPFHAFGPDKGSRACPVCKYGRYHGLLYFVGNHPDWTDIKKWLVFLEDESRRRGKYLKVYFVYGNKNGYVKAVRQRELEKIGQELNLKNIAMTFVPSLTDSESDVNLNQINPDVHNTIVLFRNRTIIDKFIDLKPTVANVNILHTTLDRTQSRYVDLPEPAHN